MGLRENSKQRPQENDTWVSLATCNTRITHFSRVQPDICLDVEHRNHVQSAFHDNSSSGATKQQTTTGNNTRPAWRCSTIYTPRGAVARVLYAPARAHGQCTIDWSQARCGWCPEMRRTGGGTASHDGRVLADNRLGVHVSTTAPRRRFLGGSSVLGRFLPCVVNKVAATSAATGRIAAAGVHRSSGLVPHPRSVVAHFSGCGRPMLAGLPSVLGATHKHMRRMYVISVCC